MIDRNGKVGPVERVDQTVKVLEIWERIWEKGPIGNFSCHEILCEMWYASSQICLQRNYPFKCCKPF